MKVHTRRRKAGSWLERSLELPVGTLTAIPRIELTGDHRLLVENGCRILSYEENEICLLTACGCVRVLGGELCIHTLSTESVLVGGHILSVEFTG